ncbi:hydroxyacid dehydrogenase [Bordetella genomosp. 12]|uniref:Dehydrogenase n=1 Tax=Bordetella genomosp. 12 TaxID=463035 RepID=A0A261VBY1_9BORD|nr:hydroxyacid dehydrogenase [Bordetella genomosp. 12]OZI71599.1 dehydrogenase [Bordetella genomosp. 12]
MKCLIVQPIHQAGIALLEEAGIACVKPVSASMDDVARAIGDCEAVITRNAGLDGRAVRAGTKLRIIGSHGAGTNMVDVKAASEAGILVVNTPGANARSVAELVMAMALALVKRTVTLDRAVRTGHWDARFEGGLRELSGMTLGIVGFGQIGRTLASMAIHGFGMRVLVYSPSVPAAQITALGCEREAELASLLARADIVSLHRPGNPGAHALMDAAALAGMKPGALLINTARASLVDESALAAQLKSGHLGGAGIDVFSEEPPPVSHPLLDCPNVVLAPHAGGSTEEALARTAIAVAQQIVDVLQGRRPTHIVNP